MTPMTITSRWQPLETFHEENACIANFTTSRCLQLEALDEVCLILLGISKAGAEIKKRGICDENKENNQVLKL